jgi:hypothetical protein
MLMHSNKLIKSLELEIEIISQFGPVTLVYVAAGMVVDQRGAFKIPATCPG